VAPWFDNRRKHPRVRPLVRKPVEIQLMGSDFLEVLSARDISLGGVGIRVDHAFSGYDLASEIQLLIKLPGKRSFIANGRVRHKATREGWEIYGVEFTRLPAEGEVDLAAYVERMLELGRKT
jgi:c-di-GMP-binding flagellar brake protein YcgR